MQLKKEKQRLTIELPSLTYIDHKVTVHYKPLPDLPLPTLCHSLILSLSFTIFHINNEHFPLLYCILNMEMPCPANLGSVPVGV